MTRRDLLRAAATLAAAPRHDPAPDADPLGRLAAIGRSWTPRPGLPACATASTATRAPGAAFALLRVAATAPTLGATFPLVVSVPDEMLAAPPTALATIACGVLDAAYESAVNRFRFDRDRPPEAPR